MNQRILTCSAIILIYLTVSACSGAKSGTTVKPDWIEDPGKTYPQSAYLSGIGSHRYLKSAKDAAIATITRQFTFSPDPGLPAYMGSVTMQRENKPLLAAITDKIQIVDTWYDGSQALYYAFAIIPKSFASDQTIKLIVALDELTREHIDRAGSTPDKLQKIARAGKALQAQVMRGFYTRVLSAIDTSGRNARLVWETARLQDDFEKLLHRILIKPLVLSDDTGALKPALIASLQDANFSVEQTAQPDYLLEGALSIIDKKTKGGNTLVSAELTVQLLGMDRKPHGKQTWPLNFSAQRDIKASAITACRELLDKELLPTIMDFATGN